MMNKRLQLIRQRMLDLLTTRKSVVTRTKYKIETSVDENGNKTQQRVEDGIYTINLHLKDWITAEKIEGGKSARKRMRNLARELIEMCNEIKKLTYELDKHAEEYKKRH